ncbi:hypothetical protein YC2023_080766 [Brassica napus]
MNTGAADLSVHTQRECVNDGNPCAHGISSSPEQKIIKKERTERKKVRRLSS